ncbi:hypothetical protein [Dietzia natronolimnaea]|uniref:hypothetical protein n=1 Tax=Dietzia natronolimnaea TaxID=161920 RepID=UPI0015FC7B6E|nr:hypothetical protein [Dietzia natronolimnaea]MBB1037345.1 hypothetical protein [Dietzia natronolimnaea]
MPNKKAEIERLKRENRRLADNELVARTVADAERTSFARTELARTDAFGTAKRQVIASELGQAMSHNSVDFMRAVAGECVTQEELRVAERYARKFLTASEGAYQEYLDRRLGGQ